MSKELDLDDILSSMSTDEMKDLMNSLKRKVVGEPVKREKVRRVLPDYLLDSHIYCEFCQGTCSTIHYFKWDLERQLHSRSLNSPPDGLTVRKHHSIVHGCPSCREYLLNLDPNLLVDYIFGDRSAICKPKSKCTQQLELFITEEVLHLEEELTKYRAVAARLAKQSTKKGRDEED